MASLLDCLQKHPEVTEALSDSDIRRIKRQATKLQKEGKSEYRAWVNAVQSEQKKLRTELDNIAEQVRDEHGLKTPKPKPKWEEMSSDEAVRELERRIDAVNRKDKDWAGQVSAIMDEAPTSAVTRLHDNYSKMQGGKAIADIAKRTIEGDQTPAPQPEPATKKIEVKEEGVTKKEERPPQAKDDGPVEMMTAGVPFDWLRPVQPQTNPASQYAEQNKRLREEHKGVWEKDKQWFKKQFAPGGLMPSPAFSKLIERDSDIGLWEFNSSHLIGELQRAIKNDYNLRAESLDERTQRLLSDALAGNIDQSIPENTKTVLLAMRQYIDRLSVEYLNSLQQQVETLLANDRSAAAEARAELMRVIANNVGAYVHRSYKAFDDPKYYKTIGDDVIDAARTYLIDRYQEQGHSEPIAQAERVINELVKHGTAYDSMEGFIKESKLGAKDLSVLMKRKDIAPEIRALLGEYTDPRINFAKSIAKMSRLIANQKFLEGVRSVGLGNFLWTKQNKPPEATAQIAGDKSEVYSPLNGLWTLPEINQAFQDALDKENIEGWLGTVIRANGTVKYGLTVLSPTTAFRNWMSAAFFTMANGHFHWRHMRKSIAGFQEYMRHRGAEGRLDYLRKLKKLGVVYDTPYAGEMMRLLADSRLADTLIAQKGGFELKRLGDLATRFYQYGDDFWKIIGFENEKQMLMRVGIEETEAETMAAQRVRDTYPTYSMVGLAIKKLRRFPLAGTFVSFPAEIIRTTINIGKYLKRDLQDPRLRPLAKQRLAGIAMASANMWALQALTKALLGYDDDDEEAVRIQSAEWNQNSQFAFVGRDQDGAILFFDMSFMDPYNYLKRPMVAMMRDQPWERKFIQSVNELWKPFLGTDILAGLAVEVASNKKETGGKVYEEFDPALYQLRDTIVHIGKTVSPGFVKNIIKTKSAIEGEVEPYGKKYHLMDEAAAWAGFRLTRLDPRISLRFKAKDFNVATTQAEQHTRFLMTDPNEVSASEMGRAYRLTNKLREKAFRDMHLLVEAALRSGLSRSEVRSVLKASRIPEREIAALFRGTVPRYRVSSRSLDALRRSARATHGPEGARRVMERRRLLGEVMRQK